MIRLATVALLLVGATWAPARADDPFLRRTTTVDVVDKAGPAVVSITSEQLIERSYGSGNPLLDQFFRNFFEPRLPRTAQELGSGVLVDRDRHVLTNAHVVERAARIRVSLSDGREFDAEVVGADAKNDIAVLVVKTEETLPWLAPGTSRDLMVGEPLIAIGNPFGLSHSVTTGVLSAINRSLRNETHTYHGFLQTDASINPGNSGGPLLNAHGRLVGVNTAVFHPAQSQGIGFAIPIDTAKRIMRELIEHGEVSPVWLGLDFQDLSPSLIEALGLPEQTRGALINRVRPESPGSRAQLRRMDVVTHLDGQALDSAQTFFERLESVTSDQEVELTLERAGERKTARVRAEEVPSHAIDALLAELTGLQVEAQNGGGFRIQSVRRGSGAARVGLTGGDLLLALDERALSDRDALRRATLGLRGRAQAMILVQRGAGRYHLALPLR